MFFFNYQLILNLSLLFIPWEFIVSALADGLSLEFERQQVSLRLQDPSQYSGHLDCLHSSTDFQVLQSL